MNPMLDTRAGAAGDLPRSLHRAVADWSDGERVAGAAAATLHAALPAAAVSVFRLGDGEPVLVAAAGAARAVGGIRSTERRLLQAALHEGASKSALDYYVEPDFVATQPGDTRSAMVVPVRAGDRVLGAIWLEYTPDAPPGDEDGSAAEGIAAYLAAAWDAASPGTRAGERGAGRGRGGKAHEALIGSLVRSGGAAGHLDEVAAAAVAVVGCDAALVLTRHPSRQMLEVVGSAGTGTAANGTLVPVDGTRAGQVFRSRAPAQVGPTDGGDPVLPSALLPQAWARALLLPITFADAATGVLVLLRGDGGAVFDAGDVRAANSLAAQASLAEALRALPLLRQRISDASMIGEVGRALTGTLGLDEVLGLVVEAAQLLVDGRGAAVALPAEDPSALMLAGVTGSFLRHRGALVPRDGSVLGEAVAAARPLVSEALSSDPRGWHLGPGFGPAALVPLMARGQTLGVLLVARGPAAHPLSDQDVDALQKLAAYASIALENAHLYRQQTELSRTLQAQASELERAYARLRESQERLLVSEKMAALGRVTAGIAHEINSPLGSILNCLQLAGTYVTEYHESAGDPEVTPDDHREIARDLRETLELAEEATRRVASFVRTIKGQTRADEDRITTFDAACEVESTVMMMRHDLDQSRFTVELELEEGLQLRGDPSRFAVVVQNLVSNALDAYAGGAGTVRVRLLRDGANARLEVHDSGMGIPEEIRPRIFDYLFTTKDVGSGTGLGLSLVHSTVTGPFGGTVDFESEPGAGTTFIVSIPLEEC